MRLTLLGGIGLIALLAPLLSKFVWAAPIQSGRLQGRSDRQQGLDRAAVADLGIVLNCHPHRPALVVEVDDQVVADGFRTAAVALGQGDVEGVRVREIADLHRDGGRACGGGGWDRKMALR